MTKDGGIFALPQGGIALEVPAGTVRQTTTVKITRAEGPKRASEGTVALGDAVDIVPAGPLAQASVRLPMNPSDLPGTGRRQATIANAFIAVLDETFDVWVPLETRYDHEAAQLVAVAPHFSRFAAFSVDPAGSLWKKTQTGVGHFKSKISKALSQVSRTFSEAANPRPDNIDCSKQGPRPWRAVTNSDHIQLCATDGNRLLRIQNDLRVPMSIRAYGHVDLSPRRSNTIDGALSVLASITAGMIGELALNGRGQVTAGLSNTAKPGSTVWLQMQPHTMAFALGFVLAALDWMPGVRTIKQALGRAFPVAIARMKHAGKHWSRDALKLLREEIERELTSAPEPLKNVAIFFDTMDCVVAETKLLLAGPGYTPADAERSGVNLAKSCVKTALKAAADQAGELLTGLGDLIASLPSSYNQIAALAEGIRLISFDKLALITIAVQPPDRCGTVADANTDFGLWEVTAYGLTCDELKPALEAWWNGKARPDQNRRWKCEERRHSDSYLITTCAANDGTGAAYTYLMIG